MIIVTGGAGFIGSQLIEGLNLRGHSDIIVVDNLENGKKFFNLAPCGIADYQDKRDFIQNLPKETKIDAIFHLGACSTTTEWNGRYMMENNYTYSKKLLDFCIEKRIPFYYASSAAVYGAGRNFKEQPKFEIPINVYGYSKALFDNYVRNIIRARSKIPLVGFRYFNVYGPGEAHKGSMASVAFHLNNQIKTTGKVKLFEGCDGYANGKQQRDFVYVADVVNTMLWFWKRGNDTGIFNIGSGRAQTFNDVANAVIAFHGRGEIEYIPFPEHLKGAYQSYTKADLTLLREAGYQEAFSTVEIGVKTYLEVLEKR